jgi:hypothetical protein
MKNQVIFPIILTVVILIGVGWFTGAVNQINSQKLQIASLNKTIKNATSQIDDLNALLEKATGTNNPDSAAFAAAAGITHINTFPTPTPSFIDPHAGMKEVKTMNCQPEGGNSATNCTEYDYWYKPSTNGSNSGQGTAHPFQY